MGETVKDLPRLLDLWVSSVDPDIVATAWEALNALDSEWHQNPAIFPEVYSLIYALGGDERGRRAAEALVLMGKRNYPQLVDAACSVDAATREVASSILARIDPAWYEDPEVIAKIDDIVEKLDSKHEAVVVAAENILIAIGLPFAKFYFPQVLNVSAARRKNAHRLLSRVSADWYHALPYLETIPILVQGLMHKSVEVSSAAFQLLSQIGEKAATFLGDALEPHAEVPISAKISVVKLLGLYAAGDDRIFELLLATWKSADNAELIAAILVALRRMEYSDPLLIEDLIHHLGHENLHVRLESMGYLSDFGSKAGRAGLALGLMLADKNKEIVAAAKATLLAIGKSAGSGLVPILSGENQEELSKIVAQYIGTYYPREMSRAVLDPSRALANMAWANLYLSDSIQRFRDRKLFILELIAEIGYRQLDLVTPLQALLSGDDEEMKGLAKRISSEIKF
jgi:hypothetical protein